MTDTNTPAPEAPVAPASTVFTFDVPNVDGTHSIDLATVPAETRMDFLKTAVRGYITNRVNAAHQRYMRDADYKLWEAYDNAQQADPMQSIVPKPPCERPAAPDLAAALTRAIADLTTGNIRKQGTEPKKRERKDPLIKAVTDVVVNELFNQRKAADPKYTYVKAKAEVGTDGVAFLNARIDDAVAKGQDRAMLEKYRDDRYIKPAKLLLGLNEKKKGAPELPNLLG